MWCPCWPSSLSLSSFMYEPAVDPQLLRADWPVLDQPRCTMPKELVCVAKTESSEQSLSNQWRANTRCRHACGFQAKFKCQQLQSVHKGPAKTSWPKRIIHTPMKQSCLNNVSMSRSIKAAVHQNVFMAISEVVNSASTVLSECCVVLLLLLRHPLKLTVLILGRSNVWVPNKHEM